MLPEATTAIGRLMSAPIAKPAGLGAIALRAHSVATRASAADVAGQPDAMKAAALMPTATMIRTASRSAT